MPIFLATMAVQPQSRIVRFESAAELLDTFGLAKGGKEYRRLVSAFDQIFGATIFFGTESSRPAAKVIHRSRFSTQNPVEVWVVRIPMMSITHSEPMAITGGA